MGLNQIFATAGDMFGMLPTVFQSGQVSIPKKIKSIIEILIEEEGISKTDHIDNILGDNFTKTITVTYDKAREAYKTFKEEQLPILLGKERTAQLAQVSSSADIRAKQMARKTVNRNMAVGVTSLALAVGGNLVYWPLKLLCVPLLLYSSRHIFEISYASLQRGKASVQLLVVVTILGSIGTGNFIVSSIAVLLFQLARRLTIEVTDDSKKKLVDVFREQPKLAWMMVDGFEVEVPVEQLRVGDRVVVHGGQPIPIDGVIVEGSASIDQHVLTGEAQPVEKSSGDEVFATTVVLSGRIQISVEKTGDETTAAQIGQMLNRTVEYKSSIQLRAESLADRTVIPTLILGAIALPILGLDGAVALVNAHFKNLMGNTSPIAIISFLNIAARRGILIKDGRTLDLLSQVDTVVFDKTGTLTEAYPSVGAIYRVSIYSEEQLLQYAAAAERNQTHPIATAICQAADQRDLPVPESSMASYALGLGISVQVEGRLVHVGSERYIQATDINLPLALQEAQESSHQQGHSLVIVAIDNEVVGAIEMVPTIRPEIPAILDELRKRHKVREIYIISGDHEAPTRALAERLGIDGYYAETLPQDKASLIEGLKAEGKFVCYVGDGINDAIALKSAHVSISLRGGSTVAKDTAQAVLMDQGLSHLPLLFELAQNCQRNLNITFATILSCTGISIFGVFFLKFGLIQTLTFNLLGLTLGTANSLRPLLQYRDPDRITT